MDHSGKGIKKLYGCAILNKIYKIFFRVDFNLPKRISKKFYFSNQFDSFGREFSRINRKDIL
jgi:hypothetical protein